MVKQKSKKIGRPIGQRGLADVFVGLRLPEKLAVQVDAWADKRDVSRSEAIRQLVELGLKR